jgi:hypothetical protein
MVLCCSVVSAVDAVYVKSAVVSALCEEYVTRRERVHTVWKKRKVAGEFAAYFITS